MNAAERPGFRITRVYTKTGDSGQTGLVGGQRISKDDVRIETYGTVDELSTELGAARLELDAESSRFTKFHDAEILAAHLKFIQNQLFTLGGDLATRIEDRHPMMPVIVHEHIEYLEQLCDHFNEALPPLKDFILPGGSRTAASLHRARTVARRAERLAVTLAGREDIGEFVVIHLNRLSDALFVLARWTNEKMNVKDYLWDRGMPVPPMPAPHVE